MAQTTKKNLSDVEEPATLEFQMEPEPENSNTEPAEASTAPPDSQPTQPKPKHAGGRPPKGQEKDTFNQIIDEIPNIQDWSNTKVYVYRDFPITNRRNGGNQYLNIETFQRPFDQGDLMKLHGSGVYGVRINKVDPTTGKDRTTLFGKVHILNMAYPPKIPRGEWVDDPRNSEWKWVKEAWEKEDEAKEKAKEAGSSAIFTPLIDMMKDQLSAYRTELATMRAQQYQRDPREQTFLSVIAPFVPKLVERFTAPPPPPPPPPAPADPLATLGAAIKLLKDLAPPPPPPPPAPVDPDVALDKSIERMEKLEARMGGRSRGSRKTGVQEAIVEGIQAAAPILGPIFGVIAQRMMQQPPAAGMNPQYSQPGMQFIGAPPEMAAAAAAAGGMGAQPQPGAAQWPAAAGATGPQLVKKPTLEAIATAVLEHLRDEKNGYQLGDWYQEKFGEAEFIEIRTQGIPRLMADLQSLPNTWRFLAQYFETGALNNMLTEFVTWEPGEPDEDEDEDDESAEDDRERPEPARQPIVVQGETPIRTGWTA